MTEPLGCGLCHESRENAGALFFSDRSSSCKHAMTRSPETGEQLSLSLDWLNRRRPGSLYSIIEYDKSHPPPPPPPRSETVCRMPPKLPLLPITPEPVRDRPRRLLGLLRYVPNDDDLACSLILQYLLPLYYEAVGVGGRE
jgi:hypothetical protein